MRFCIGCREGADLEAVFFSAMPDSATRIRSADDLEGEWLGEPLAVGSPGVVSALARAAGLHSGPAIETLRDATCQSFPVWVVARSLIEFIANVDEDEIDGLVERWHEEAAAGELDADAYELSMWLTEMRDALREAGREDETVFVLFEEKAMMS